MAEFDARLSTGLSGLDRMLKGIIAGDNIVWQVDSREDYEPFVRPFCDAADRLGHKLTYFRFNRSAPALVEPAPGVEVVELDPSEGFEVFVKQVHGVIERNGRGGYYAFDCLSDLATHWYSDRMLGNFFMLTCPYLYDVEAVAYFALLRNHHSFHATSAILNTTQVLLDVYHRGERIYLHPWKVQARYSPTMHMLHIREGESFRPITESATISQVRTSAPWSRLESGGQNIGIWSESFFEAKELLDEQREGVAEPARVRECLRRLLRMAISRDARILELTERYFTLEDLLDIERRMIGTGLIGGKSVGMLLARAILRADAPDLGERLEPHDSFYIGSDVFYTFLVRNGLWWIRETNRDPEALLQRAGRGRHRMLMGEFPEYIQKQFEDMLDYFGQSPIIVRSSSLLEDNFGNAFAGKYESIFCANQGPRHRRLDDFLSAVRTIYASSMSEKALVYRRERGLLQCDEQMSLLVQRVSGRMHGHLYYPTVAGVGFSFNPYVWNKSIDPDAGLARLVAGMGTRAVDRSDDDYTRVIALNAPDRRPESTFDEVQRYSQRRLDVLDLEANQLVSVRLGEALDQSRDLPLDLLVSRHAEMDRPEVEVLTFDGLVGRTPFVQDLQRMLRTLHEAYDYPVDVEFAANFPEDDHGYRLNVLQCRPLQVKTGGAVGPAPQVQDDRLILEARGAVIGVSRSTEIGRLIYVPPAAYAELHQRDRYNLARLVGRVCHLGADRAPGGPIMLVGPGRWGTTTPSLGVPVQFADINNVSLLCEVVQMQEDLVPDVSLGTHFFSDLVEQEIMYFALMPAEGNTLNLDLLDRAHNRLPELLPDDAEWASALRVIEGDAFGPGTSLHVHADSREQRVVCYLVEPA